MHQSRSLRLDGSLIFFLILAQRFSIGLRLGAKIMYEDHFLHEYEKTLHYLLGANYFLMTGTTYTSLPKV